MKLLHFCLLLLVASTAFAEPPPWHIANAPFRASVRLTAAPELPEAGIEINLQEFGQTRPDLGDLVLTNANGEPQPLAKIASRRGGRVLLLAQKLEPNAPYFLYFGGGAVRNCPAWNPVVSLLMETRPAPADLKFDSLQSLQNAWERSPEPPGAAFVQQIYHAGNPFGPNTSFLTHYTGVLRISEPKEITFYTLSSDCSFVLVNDQLQLSWPGQHTAYAEPKNVVKKNIPCPAGLVKIDYYAAKGDDPKAGHFGAASVFGWEGSGGFAAVPPKAWVHPGSAAVGPVQSADGQTVPLARASVESHIGFAGQWFFETRFELRPPPPPGWNISWEFPDGASASSASGTRILTGWDSPLIQCQLTRNGLALNTCLRLDIPDSSRRASANQPAEMHRYLSLITAEADCPLKPDTVRARLAFLNECGSDAEIARLAAKWPTPAQTDPLWPPVRLAAIRIRAQADPAGARQEFLQFLQSLDAAARKSWRTEIAATEMDIRIFCQRDPEAFGPLAQLAFANPDGDLNRLIKIRIGDLHRLLGRAKEAAAQYQSVGIKGNGDAAAVKDSAASVAVRDLLERDFLREAQASLAEWELRRPMAKFDSDFLLLRARILLELGRWREALAELECYQSVQSESPFQTDAQFYLARILWEQGSKDEARKIWKTFAADYPRHPLAQKATEWAAKP